MSWILGLMACNGEPESEVVLSYEFDAEDQRVPVAPWDPVALSVWRVCETDSCGEGVGPTCQETLSCWQPSGVDVDASVPLQDIATPNTGRVYAEVPVEEWPVGPMKVIGSIDGEEALIVETEVLAGVTPEPGAWKVEGGWGPSGLEALMEVYYDAWLVLDEVDAETARFRVIADAGKGPCTFIEDDAELLDGELFWEKRELTPSIEPPVDAYDLWFRVLFVEGGGGVGGEMHVLGDLRAFDAALEADPESQALCPLLVGFGFPCEAKCPDGDLACLDLRVHQMTLEPTLPGAWDELPRCGLDATDPEAQVWSCDTDIDFDFDVCSTTGALAVGWPALVLALGVLRRRRS